jgi:hypothetical protein
MTLALSGRLGLLALCLAFTATQAGCCLDPPYYTTKDSRYIPKSGLGETLPCAPNNADPNARLSFNALYVKYWDDLNPPSVTWYRFFADGRVLIRGEFTADVSAITPALGDDFSRGIVGRYCVVGEKLQIEVFDRRPDGSFGFWTYFGQINPDGSITMISVLREFTILPFVPQKEKLGPRWTYKPVAVPGMVRQADW